MAEVPDFRERAREHLESARQHLASDEDTRLRYAALEQRMCIESLAYNLLQLHRSEASFSLMHRWQADQVLKELGEMVRGVTGDQTIELNFEGFDKITETEYRMGLSWVRKSYQSLGSFLHTPTIREIEAGEAATFKKMKTRCSNIQQRLEEIFSSEMFNITINRNCEWVCDFDGCTFIMERDLDWFTANNTTNCPKCGAEHNAWLKGGRVWHKIRVGNWQCPKCGMKNAAAAHQIKAGAIVTCSLCDEQFEFREQIRLFPVTKRENGH